MEKNNLLALFKNVRVFNNKKHLILDNISLEIYENEVLALIGENGSGKSTLISLLTGLNVNLFKITNGEVYLNEINVTNFKEQDWEHSKLRKDFVAMVFQNPSQVINPHLPIKRQFIGLMKVHHPKLSKLEMMSMIIHQLVQVKIENPEAILNSYGWQLSSGTNQKVVIAMALLTNAKLIIFDEPTSNLDTLSQNQILEIIKLIKQTTKIGIVFATQAISLPSKVADTIAIMYAGRIIEQGTNKEIYNYPLHPYTWELLKLSINEEYDQDSLFSKNRLEDIKDKLGEIPYDPFAMRNQWSLRIDFELKPPKFQISPTHYVYSWLYDKNSPKFEPPILIKDLWEKHQK